jgi:two-component system response regulator FixJ
MAEEARVYVIDDDDAMRDSLAFLLQAARLSVEVFPRATDFLDVLPRLKSGCVVTDVRMPGMGGLDLLRHVRANRPALPVVIMTGHGDVPLAVEAMKLGAYDFVEKPFEDERLIDTIKTALEGSRDAAMAEETTSDLASRIAALSAREHQVMVGLVAGLSSKAIARDHDISHRTVEVYRAHVMTKMRAASLSELVRLAIRAGLLKD